MFRKSVSIIHYLLITIIIIICYSKCISIIYVHNTWPFTLVAFEAKVLNTVIKRYLHINIEL